LKNPPHIYIIDKQEKRIHFLHKSYIEFFLAEHLVDQYIHENIYSLNIGKPSEVTVEFLRGFLDLLKSDETTVQKYVIYNKSNANTLFSSLNYGKNSEETLEKAKENILNTAKKSFDNEKIITVNLENNFKFALDNQDNKELENTSNKIFWIENLQSNINNYENLWYHRWTSLTVIKKLLIKENMKMIIEKDKDKLRRLLLAFSYSTPSHLKDLSYLDLSSLDLERIVLAHADLSFVDFRYSNLIASNLLNSNLYSANLINADLSRALIYNTILNYANLQDVDLGNANLHFAKLNYANLSCSYKNQSKLYRTRLNYSQLSWANLAGANLEQSDLSNANLANSSLLYCKWHNLKCDKSTNVQGALINDEKLVQYLKKNDVNGVPSFVPNDKIQETMETRKQILKKENLNEDLILNLTNIPSIE
jgi:uncharacterized protein YjbI with pentapeptide repeats